MNLTFPTVHLNGTSADSLIEGLCNADFALHNAIEKLCEAGPNARDFYVQGDRAYEQARREHQARLDKLKAVADELLAIAESVDEQRTARAR